MHIYPLESKGLSFIEYEATTISSMENVSSYGYNSYLMHYIMKEYSDELYTFQDFVHH